MDDVAHILWSIIIFYNYSWWIAALFGILPDILAFVPFYTYKFLKGNIKNVNDVQPNHNIAFYKKWVTQVYDATHSVPVAILVIAICTFLFGYHLEYWAMIIHILADIPSHRRAWFGTKIFWPFSNFQFNGTSWATRDFMLANYTGLALVYAIRLFGF